MGRLVWAFEPLDETGGETGFVDMADEETAEKLIKSGKVQCGWAPSEGELKYIDGQKVAAYATRQLKAGGPRPKAAAPANKPAPSAPDEPAKPARAPEGPETPTAPDDAPEPAPEAPESAKAEPEETPQEPRRRGRPAKRGDK